MGPLIFLSFFFFTTTRHVITRRVAGIPDDICWRDRNSRNQVPQYRRAAGEETRQLTRAAAKFARPPRERAPRSTAYCIRGESPATIAVPGAYLSFERAPVINCRGKNGSAFAFFEFRPNFRANGDKRRRNLWPPTRKVPRARGGNGGVFVIDEAPTNTTRRALTAIQSRPNDNKDHSRRSDLYRATIDYPPAVFVSRPWRIIIRYRDRVK